MNGFDLIAQCLKAEGVTWMGCFPANPLIEAVSKIGIKPIVFRQERGAINAVDGYARTMMGKMPGIRVVCTGLNLPIRGLRRAITRLVISLNK